MIRTTLRWSGALALALLAAPADAQPLGTFRWQLQPHCNVLSLTVTQVEGVYRLEGTDDQCGAGRARASVLGLAFQNPSGAIGMGLTIVTAPGGVAVHVDAADHPGLAEWDMARQRRRTGRLRVHPGRACPRQSAAGAGRRRAAGHLAVARRQPGRARHGSLRDSRERSGHADDVVPEQGGVPRRHRFRLIAGTTPTSAPTPPPSASTPRRRAPEAPRWGTASKPSSSGEHCRRPGNGRRGCVQHGVRSIGRCQRRGEPGSRLGPGRCRSGQHGARRLHRGQRQRQYSHRAADHGLGFVQLQRRLPGSGDR